MAFLVCGEFCGESGLRKLGLCGTHPLTQRYVLMRIRDISRKSLWHSSMSISYSYA
nr:DUF3265 domain-containing protein [Vibrio vulnificus]